MISKMYNSHYFHSLYSEKKELFFIENQGSMIEKKIKNLRNLAFSCSIISLLTLFGLLCIENKNIFMITYSLMAVSSVGCCLGFYFLEHWKVKYDFLIENFHIFSTKPLSQITVDELKKHTTPGFYLYLVARENSFFSLYTLKNIKHYEQTYRNQLSRMSV